MYMRFSSECQMNIITVTISKPTSKITNVLNLSMQPGKGNQKLSDLETSTIH